MTDTQQSDKKKKEEPQVYISRFDMLFGHGDDEKGVSHNDLPSIAAGEEFTKEHFKNVDVDLDSMESQGLIIRKESE